MGKDYLDLLNPQQREAVVYKDGPSLVIAGAGSGKTRVLTYKIVDLLENGYDSSRILALTFTNKAAREMKQRVERVVGAEVASRLWMGTFHSIFLRILHRHYEAIGFRSNFTIYDSGDSRSLLKMIVKEMDLDDKSYKIATVANIISKWKNEMLGPEDVVRDKKITDSEANQGRPAMAAIYDSYCRRLRLANAMDFDDILYFTNLLLSEREDIRLHYQRYFQYVLVDEYQDTNFSQDLIIRQLVGDTGKLCVVGDDAQSIYSFRGANLMNILNLERRYPGLKQFKLERNYRSTQNIVNAAGSLIKYNTRQLKKDVYSENEAGKKVAIVHAYSDFEEGGLIAAMVMNAKNSNRDSYEDYAILYRTNAQSRIFEEALRKKAIPYRIYGGTSFYQRKEVKDAICYFRVAQNPHDDEALRRIINIPSRKIGETTMKKAFTAASESSTSIWEVIKNPDAFTMVKFGSATKKALRGFVELIELFHADVQSGRNAFEVAQLIYNRSGLLTQFANDYNTPEEVNRLENLRELLSAVKEFTEQRLEEGSHNISMNDYLSEISLATDQDEGDETAGEKVTMMTVHAAKGLEFKHVYVVGMEEELFPSYLAETAEDIEEERRLLYVAITRAMTTCTLTYASTRYRNGQTSAPRPSRFLRELNPKYVSIGKNVSLPGEDFGKPETTRRPTARNVVSPYAKTPSREIRTPSTPFVPPPRVKENADEFTIHDPLLIRAGMKILHSRFGEGTITGFVDGPGDTILVDFKHVGEKRMLLKFAKFKIL